MIHNKTARALLYAWHGGQYSAFYEAASSGLVENFDRLIDECSKIDNPDKGKLMLWIVTKRKKHTEVFISNSWYAVMPWISRP